MGLFFRGWSAPLPVKRKILMLQHTKTFWTMLCFQLCGNSLWKAFSISAWLWPSAQSKIHGWMSLVWKNLSCSHRVLTSTPSNTFGMNWNKDCTSGLLIQHQCLNSQMLYWMNVQKFHSKILCKSSQNSGIYYNCIGETNNINRYSWKYITAFIF